jgi:hypothetical protein
MIPILDAGIGMALCEIKKATAAQTTTGDMFQRIGLLLIFGSGCLSMILD